MPQFAVTYEVKISRDENVGHYLNATLIENPTWKVIAINHVLSGKVEVIQLTTVVYDAPVEDMPSFEKVVV